MPAKKTESAKTAKKGKSIDSPPRANGANRTSEMADAEETDLEDSSIEEDGEDKAAISELARRLLAGESDKTIASLGDDLVSGKKSAASTAARAIDEVLEAKPELVVPIIDRFVKAIAGEDKRPAQTAANALPVMARVAPARVARHLPRLKDSFDVATPVGKDGLVRTFAGLCTASVAYQKRLEGVLNKALNEADAKTLQKWTEIVLPALKGEPHARARATVEARLGRIPKVVAQKIADFLGIKLRLRY
jgi:hypothetical protein